MIRLLFLIPKLIRFWGKGRVEEAVVAGIAATATEAAGATGTGAIGAAAGTATTAIGNLNAIELYR